MTAVPSARNMPMNSSVTRSRAVRRGSRSHEPRRQRSEREGHQIRCGTITWLPSVGQVIKPGQALYKVGGEPVIIMNGTTPAYRNLSASDSAGQDILQLNRNLVYLGFDPDGIVIDDEWQPATTGGVDLLQTSLRETETGSLTLGKIVFLPGAQLISTVDATLGSTGGASGGGTPSSSTNTSLAVTATAAEFVGLRTSSTASPSASTAAGSTSTTPKATKPKPTKPKATKTKPTKPKTTKPGSGHGPGSSGSTGNSQTLQALIALLKAEVAQLKAAKASPSTSAHPSSSSPSGRPTPPTSSSPPSSSGGGSASAILQTTSTRLVVTVDLDATKQSEAKVGEKVSVEMPAGNTVGGKITGVSPVAQTSNSGNNSNSNGNTSNGNTNNSPSAGGGGGSSSATIPVTIALSGHQAGAGLDQAAVSVNFIQAVANHVLSVPVTALLATSGGGYAVQEAAAPRKLIPVTTGLFAAGYVQISGPRIYPGLQVTDSQG
jgi:hypothetical protein